MGVPALGRARVRQIPARARGGAGGASPADVLPNRVHRAIPYLYSQQEILALMDATTHLRSELAERIHTLAGIPSLQATMAELGQAVIADRYSWARVCQAYLDVAIRLAATRSVHSA